MATGQTKAVLVEDAYRGFMLRLGEADIKVTPVAGASLAMPDTESQTEIQVEILMRDVNGRQKFALTERVRGPEQLRAVLSQWRAILS